MNLQTCQLDRDFDFSDGPSLGIFDANSRCVVGTAVDWQTQALFVAAPDMLAALKLIAGCWDPSVRPPPGTNETQYMRAARAIHSAIAKAEGRS